ncbi:S9 family peptidase [Parvularcula sp. ZS-1/3]|uniref:S9 family peptidase n=1 Tax=Parvularcula mediterranea TaxID=2732508 RepID=A0A7Y3W3R8_9PROT|nr:S9 family peptidase [Parvularcula mediterranea]
MLRAVIALLATLAFLTPASAQNVPTFEAFSQDPAITDADISPNGRWLAVVQRASVDGERFLRIYDAKNLSKGHLRTLGGRNIEVSGVTWANNDTLVVNFIQQVNDGPNTFQIGKVATINRTSGGFNEIPKIQFDRKTLGSDAELLQQQAGASVISNLPHDPEHIIISYTADFTRGSGGFRPVRYVGKVNLKSGRVVPTFRGDTRYGGYRVDQDGNVRLAGTTDPATGDAVSVARASGSEEWIEIGRSGAGTSSTSQQFAVLGFSSVDDPNELLVVSNHESDTSGIYTFDIPSRRYKELLFRHPRYDAGSVRFVRDPKNLKQTYITGFTYTGRGGEVVWIDDFEKQFHEQLKQVLTDRVSSVWSQSRDGNVRVIQATGEKYPRAFYLYTPDDGIQLIGESMPQLRPEQLAERKYIRYKARDGYEIPAYVTIPNGTPPFPTVNMPHGGPTARDTGGFDLWAQVLASRGYAVIQPQFRVSTGFGREHLEAGFSEWGKLQQDDIDDAMKFMVDAGIADEDRLAIFGWSYGGYASAMGIMRDNHPYKCAIPSAGVYDLPRFRAWLFQGGGGSLARRYRDTVEGLNPLDYVSKVDVPVLIIHGTNDERVPIIHSDLLNSALKREGKDVEYLKLKDANHFFGTIFYRHWMEMFPTMVRFLDEDCGLKP